MALRGGAAHFSVPLHPGGGGVTVPGGVPCGDVDVGSGHDGVGWGWGWTCGPHAVTAARCPLTAHSSTVRWIMAFFSQPRFVYGFNWSSLGSLHSNCRNFSKVVVIFFEVQINFFFLLYSHIQ